MARKLNADELVRAFSPCDPVYPAFRFGTFCSWAESEMLIEREGTQSLVSASPSTLEEMYRLLSPATGNGLVFAEVLERSSDPHSLREIVHQLAFQGYLEDIAEVPTGGCSGFNIVSRLQDVGTKANSEAGAVVRGICDGSVSRTVAQQWTEAQFHFTASAQHHISPVLRHARTQEEHEAWRSFLEDESTHWKIYKKAFADFGTDFTDVASRTPTTATAALISHLHRLATVDQYEYAAACLIIEEPCDEGDVLSNPLYGGLHNHFGLRLEAVRPLYWHSRENETKGHRDMMAAVLASRPYYEAKDVDRLVGAVRQTVALTHSANDLQ